MEARLAASMASEMFLCAELFSECEVEVRFLQNYSLIVLDPQTFFDIY